MLVPESNSKNILNKEVVFRSGINPDLKNYNLTSVTNIKKDAIVSYLKNIINLNKNVIFYEISYDEKTEKIYFYTNKELRFAVFSNQNIKHQNLISTSTLLTTIKNLKNDLPNSDSNLISLLDISNYITEMHLKYLELKLKYERRFNTLLGPILRDNISIYNYNYNNNTVTLALKNNSKANFTVTLSNNDLTILNSSNIAINNILYYIKNELIAYLNELSNFNNIFSDEKHRIRPVNSDFFIDISASGIDIYAYLDPFNKYFELLKLNTGETIIDSSSSIVKEALINEKNAILSKTLIFISDLPQWLQTKIKAEKSELTLKKAIK